VRADDACRSGNRVTSLALLACEKVLSIPFAYLIDGVANGARMHVLAIGSRGKHRGATGGHPTSCR